MRVIANRGLEAVSLRNVAAADGVSMGMVPHCFSCKDRKLIFACTYLIERTWRRITDHPLALPATVSGREILRDSLFEILPPDAERRAGTRVWMAFLTLATRGSELTTYMRDT